MEKPSGSGENSLRTLSNSPERDAESVVCEIFHKSFFTGTSESWLAKTSFQKFPESPSPTYHTLFASANRTPSTRGSQAWKVN